MSTSSPAPAGAGNRIDPRGPRFGAGLTAVLLAVVVIAGPTPVGTALLALVVVSFAVGAWLGVRRTWQGVLYAGLVRPRLGPPRETEDQAPPRFAQLVGLVITGAGLVLGIAGVPVAVGSRRRWRSSRRS